VIGLKPIRHNFGKGTLQIGPHPKWKGTFGDDEFVERITLEMSADQGGSNSGARFWASALSRFWLRHGL
jgi:hypothetical protein